MKSWNGTWDFCPHFSNWKWYINFCLSVALWFLSGISNTDSTLAVKLQESFYDAGITLVIVFLSQRSRSLQDGELKFNEIVSATRKWHWNSITYFFFDFANQHIHVFGSEHHLQSVITISRDLWLKEKTRLKVMEGAKGNLPDSDAQVAALAIKDLVTKLTDRHILIVLISGNIVIVCCLCS